MKGLKKIFFICVILSLLFIAVIKPKEVKCATSYTNAKEFYNTCSNKDNHIEMVNGTIYVSTKSKLASSSTSLRYRTVGFDIQLQGNGQTQTISVKRGGSYLTEVSDIDDDDGYNYDLYKIEYDTIHSLCVAQNATIANQLFDANSIRIKIDTILVTNRSGVLSGSIVSEGSNGTIAVSGNVYHLSNPSDLSVMLSTFTSNFTTMKDIVQYVNNYSLTTTYYTETENVTVGNGYSIDEDGKIVGSEQTQKQWGTHTIKTQSDFDLKKTGYHLYAGSEWKCNNGYYTAGNTYYTDQINSDVKTQNASSNFWANFEANRYYIRYDKNGGNGFQMEDTKCTYDSELTLKNCNYRKEGYVFVGWGFDPLTKEEDTYASGTVLKNVTAENEKVVTLYAIWKPETYQVSMNHWGGTSGGTENFYEEYETKWKETLTSKNKLTQVNVATKTGYNLEGYYTGVLGTGTQLLNSSGTVVDSTAKLFLQDSMIYADWTPKTYLAVLDKQGGTGGTDSVIVTYGEEMPVANNPTLYGFTFDGYYDDDDNPYYNEFMASMQRYLIDADIELRAKWKDITPPEIVLIRSHSNWTNGEPNEAKLTATARDYGTGLASVSLWQGENKLYEKTDLDGVNEYTFEYKNIKEGAYSYKLVATDASGNTSETYQVMYYDIKEPTYSDINYSYDASNRLTYQLHVSDYDMD